MHLTLFKYTQFYPNLRTVSNEMVFLSKFNVAEIDHPKRLRSYGELFFLDENLEEPTFFRHCLRYL